MIRASVGDDPRDYLQSYDGLLAEFAKRVGAKIIVRGLRGVSEFECETQMALMNRQLHPSLETVFLVPAVDLTYLSSSLVREVARYGGDVSGLGHPGVAKALGRRVAGGASLPGCSARPPGGRRASCFAGGTTPRA